MKILRKFTCIVCGLCFSVLMSYLSMTHGWGLEVKSWGWIIGAGIFGQIMAQVLVFIGTGKGGE